MKDFFTFAFWIVWFVRVRTPTENKICVTTFTFTLTVIHRHFRFFLHFNSNQRLISILNTCTLHIVQTMGHASCPMPLMHTAAANRQAHSLSHFIFDLFFCFHFGLFSFPIEFACCISCECLRLAVSLHGLKSIQCISGKKHNEKKAFKIEFN